jgi:hypothetical protein
LRLLPVFTTAVVRWPERIESEGRKRRRRLKLDSSLDFVALARPDLPRSLIDSEAREGKHVGGGH